MVNIYDKHIPGALSRRCLKTECWEACLGLEYTEGRKMEWEKCHSSVTNLSLTYPSLKCIYVSFPLKQEAPQVSVELSLI